jgi:hypothetical protein
MNRQDLIEREDRNGRIAGILGISGVLGMILLPPLLGLSGEFSELAQDDFVGRLEAFEAARDDLFAGTLIQSAGIALFAAPLVFLFQAVAARNPKIYKGLIGLAILGPVLVAASGIFSFAAFDSVASEFLDNAPAGVDQNEAAEDALRDETSFQIFVYLQLAGGLSLAVAIVYTSFQAMKAGLLTRFLGALGIAAGAGFLLLGGLGQIFLFGWIVAVSLLIARWWFGDRPPAWAASEAIPWPKPGEQPPPTEEELADPSEFADADGDGLPDGPDAEQDFSKKQRASAKKRKKRKR